MGQVERLAGAGPDGTPQAKAAVESGDGVRGDGFSGGGLGDAFEGAEQAAEAAAADMAQARGAPVGQVEAIVRRMGPPGGRVGFVCILRVGLVSANHLIRVQYDFGRPSTRSAR